jgi:hypothetical protein
MRVRSTSSCIDTGKGFCLPQTTWYFFWATAVGTGIIGGWYLRLRLRLIERWSAQEALEPWEFVKAHRPRRRRISSVRLLISELVGIAAGILITLAWAHSAEVILLGAVPGAAAGLIGRQCWNDWWLLHYKNHR